MSPGKAGAADLTAHGDAVDTGDAGDVGDTPQFVDWLASSVHDMKNSLGFVLNSLEELALADTPVLSREALGKLLFESGQVSRQLLQLLALFKMERANLALNAADHDVQEFLEDCRLLQLPLIETKSLRCEVDCPPGLHWAFDSELIAGVVANAIGNALRYARSALCLAAERRGDVLELRIDDDGPGFPESMLQRVDAPVERVDFHSGSTGLGLYFSSQVAAMHHHDERRGAITLRNGGSLGGGSVLITLP